MVLGKVQSSYSPDNSPEKKGPSPYPSSSEVAHYDIRIENDNWTETGSALSELIDDIIAKKTVSISEETRDLLIDMQLVVFESYDKPEFAVKGLPYFESEREKHASIFKLNRNIDSISELIEKYGNDPEEHDSKNWNNLLNGLTKRFRKIFLRESAENALHKATSERDTVLKELLSHADADNSQTNFGAIRIAPEALQLFSTVSHLPDEPKQVRPLAWTTILYGHFEIEPDTQDILKDCIAELMNLNDPKHPRREIGGADYLARDLRKLYLGLVSGALLTSPAVFGKRMHLINIYHYMDLYLADPGSETSKKAEKFLKERKGGSYCPNPYPSWKLEQKVRAHAEAQEIVIAGQTVGRSFSQLSQETKRLPNGEDPLLLRFAQYACDDIKAIYGSSSNQPPGRGWLFGGLDLSKVLFKPEGCFHPDVEGFYLKNKDWIKGEIREVDQTNFGFLRGAEIVRNPSDYFVVKGEHYTLVVFNDHFSESYDAAWLFPSSVIDQKIRKCLYKLDQKGPIKAENILEQGFTAEELAAECIERRRAPLNLSWLSTLFGGCGFSFPVGWGSHFGWEKNEQNVAWKDANGHVHLSWKIWNFRSDRSRVDAALKDDQILCHEVYEVARAYFSLLAIFKNRYAAWKCNQTPESPLVPRMLVESYKWHHQTEGRPLSERPVLCYSERGQTSTNFTPLIDTASMKLFTDSKVIQLPKWSDGSENTELSLWKRHVSPLLTIGSETKSESNNALFLVGREYVTF